MKKKQGFYAENIVKLLHKNQNKILHKHITTMFLKLSTQKPNLQYKESYFYIEKNAILFHTFTFGRNNPKFLTFPR